MTNEIDLLNAIMAATQAGAVASDRIVIACGLLLGAVAVLVVVDVWPGKWG